MPHCSRWPVSSRDGYRALRRFARRWPNADWAIEEAAGVGAPLTRRRRADGSEVIDVPATLDYGPVDRIRAALMAVVVRFRSTRAQL